MEDKFIDALENLDISETSALLDNIPLEKINSKVNKRITSNVKAKLNIKNNQPSLLSLFNFNFKKILTYNFAVAFTFLICFIPLSHYNNKIVSYVSFDINPSIEVGLNSKDLVVEYTALNDDGSKIIDSTAPINIPVEDALEFLINKSISTGFLTSNDVKDIILSTTTSDTDKNLMLESSLISKANDILTEKGLEINVEGCTSTPNFRDEAKEYGLSPGKFKIIKEIQELDNTINIDSLKEKSMSQLKYIYNSYFNNNTSESTGTDADNSNSDEASQSQNNNNNNNNNNSQGSETESTNGNGNEPNSNGNGNKPNSSGNNQSNKPSSNGNGNKANSHGNGKKPNSNGNNTN